MPDDSLFLHPLTTRVFFLSTPRCILILCASDVCRSEITFMNGVASRKFHLLNSTTLKLNARVTWTQEHDCRRLLVLINIFKHKNLCVCLAGFMNSSAEQCINQASSWCVWCLWASEGCAMSQRQEVIESRSLIARISFLFWKTFLVGNRCDFSSCLSMLHFNGFLRLFSFLGQLIYVSHVQDYPNNMELMFNEHKQGEIRLNSGCAKSQIQFGRKSQSNLKVFWLDFCS